MNNNPTPDPSFAVQPVRSNSPGRRRPLVLTICALTVAAVLGMSVSASGGISSLVMVAVIIATPRARGGVGLIGLALVTCMILQRTMVNAHWLSDTLEGAALAIGWGALCLLLGGQAERDRGTVFWRRARPAAAQAELAVG